MPEGLAPVMENPDYFDIMDATVTVRASKSRETPYSVLNRLLPNRKRTWSGTFREEFVIWGPDYGEEDYLVLYREGGFDDPYEASDWDWTLAVKEHGEMWFDYGEPYHVNWEPQAVEVATDV